MWIFLSSSGTTDWRPNTSGEWRGLPGNLPPGGSANNPVSNEAGGLCDIIHVSQNARWAHFISYNETLVYFNLIWLENNGSSIHLSCGVGKRIFQIDNGLYIIDIRYFQIVMSLSQYCWHWSLICLHDPCKWQKIMEW